MAAPSNYVPEGPPEIASSETQPQRQIGEGSFGKVYLGKCRGKDVAIKYLRKQSFMDAETRDAFRNEVAVMRRIYHPNVVLFLGACTETEDPFIVSEYLPHGDLETILRNPANSLTLFTRMVMAKDAALGMNWLHQSTPQCIHRDLKTSNLLVADDGRIKVCDFGLSQFKPHGENLRDFEEAQGTPLYMAPEVMQHREFDEKCDVYSFGIVLWELVTRERPYPQYNRYAQLVTAVCEDEERPPIPEGLEPELEKLMRRCWAPSPRDRPAFDEIVRRMDMILVDVALHCEWARDFWLENFLGRVEVGWAEFAKALMMDLGVEQFDLTTLDHPSTSDTILGFKCLRALLAERGVATSAPIVSLHTFGRVIGYFAGVTTNKSNFMANIVEHLQQPWLYGNISQQEAEQRLSDRPPGTFLVRFSSQPDESWFSISQVHEDGVVRHQRVKHTCCGAYYLTPEEKFDTLQQLLKSKGYVLSPVIGGSKYHSIFSLSDDSSAPGYID